MIAHDATELSNTLTKRVLSVTNPSSALFFDERTRDQSGALDITTTDVQLHGVKLAVGPATAL